MPSARAQPKRLQRPPPPLEDRKSKARRLHTTLAIGLLAMPLWGCAPAGMFTRAVSYKMAPSLAKARRSAPEANVLVWGSLRAAAGTETASPSPISTAGATYVLAVSGDPQAPEVVALDRVDAEDRFWLWLPAANYRLLAFSDRNEDGVLQRDELVGRSPAPVTVGRTSSNHGLVSHAEVHQSATGKTDAGFDLALELADHPGKRPPSTVYSLDDKRFAPDVGQAGMLEPADFFQTVGPVQFLGKPDFSGRRVPVIFVHGIDGTPRDFAALAQRLDSSRYQAWFFYYPSGARLETSAALLHEVFFSGHVLPRMPVYALVAHSMGGLVAREALNYEAESIQSRGGGPERSPIAFYASFASPYGGVEIANMGAHYSPVRIASWIDIASGSDFLDGLYRSPLPRETRFGLFTAHSEGDSDGVIPVESQLFAPARAAAHDVSSNNVSHVGILSDDEVLLSYVDQLDRATQRATASAASTTVPRINASPKHNDETPVPPSGAENNSRFGGPGAPPPFTAFVGLGPTLGGSEVGFLVHLIVQLNLFYGHVGLGLDAMPSVYNPVRRHGERQTQFSATLLGTGPRLRLGGDSSWIGLDVGGNGGVILGTTASGTDDIPQAELFAEGHLERDTVAAAWFSTTLSLRLALDFYVRGGVWAGSTFRPLRVATKEQQVASWGVLFGNASLGLEVRLP